MGKIGLIIRREYFTRVKNKTFIIMCFLAPVLWGALIIVPAMLARSEGAPRTIVVVEMIKLDSAETAFNYHKVFHDTMNLHFDFHYVRSDVDETKKLFKDSDQVSILEIPANFFGGNDSAAHSVGRSAILHSKNEPGYNTLGYIEFELTKLYRTEAMRLDSVPEAAINIFGQKISVGNSIRGKESKTEIKVLVGIGFAMIIYMFIFLYGVQVMRGVIEEKTTRIVEVIVSSVRPFQLMLGKVIGVALVGVTQFTIWVLLSFLIITPLVNSVQDKKLDFTQANSAQMNKVMPENEKGVMEFDTNDQMDKTVATLMSIPWGNMILCFFLYFILGYLMYGAMFAAVGSAVDSEADTQQFMLPVSIPLIISVALSGTIASDPDGSIATWLSYIPFTSPVAMLMRLPFGGVYAGEVILSLSILAISFLAMTWVAGKIYRTGILMYGKKPSWKEIGKWLFYRG
ncbi:MAG: hypothetical protein FD123_1452 [Bacteroidetes bacterium]|nr:MAG: hypothetical protein FD123_1452 [Bacteroidota bacterium]